MGGASWFERWCADGVGARQRKGKERERKGKEGKGREKRMGKEGKRKGKEGKERERKGKEGKGRERNEWEKKPLEISEFGCPDGCGRRGCKGGWKWWGGRSRW